MLPSVYVFFRISVFLVSVFPFPSYVVSVLRIFPFSVFTNFRIYVSFRNFRFRLTSFPYCPDFRIRIFRPSVFRFRIFPFFRLTCVIRVYGLLLYVLFSVFRAAGRRRGAPDLRADFRAHLRGAAGLPVTQPVPVPKSPSNQGAAGLSRATTRGDLSRVRTSSRLVFLLC